MGEGRREKKSMTELTLLNNSLSRLERGIRQELGHFFLSRHSVFSTFLFSEPDFSYLDALAPYQPLAMKCVYCPIDTRLNFIQVSKLLKEVQVMNFCCLFLRFFTHSCKTSPWSGWEPVSTILLVSEARRLRHQAPFDQASCTRPQPPGSL